MKIYCPACTMEFEVEDDTQQAECPNLDCHAPYHFRIFRDQETASDSYKITGSWLTKYLFQPAGTSGIWVVAYFNEHIQPFQIRSISSLIGEEILRSIQAGAGDNLGGPITLIEIKKLLPTCSIELEFQDTLDSEVMSPQLQEALSESLQITLGHGEPSLSENSTVSVVESGSRWLITDLANQRAYAVTREDRLSINTEFWRIEPLEHADPGPRPPHMRGFCDFCTELRMKSKDNISGDDLCIAFDFSRTEEYINEPPYEAEWHYCWCHLVDYIAPVVVNGEITGVLFTGQKRMEDPKFTEAMERCVKEASCKLGIDDLDRMLNLARKVEIVDEGDIERDLEKLREAAKRLVNEAEDKYGAERQVRESYFMEEIAGILTALAGKTFEKRSELWKETEVVLRRIVEFVECFDSIALLYETRERSNSFRIVAGHGEVKRDFEASIPDEDFDELMPDRLGPLSIMDGARKQLRERLSNNIVSYKIDAGYVIRMRLQSGHQMLLVVTSPEHTCRFCAADGFCHQRSRLGRRFLAQLGSVLSKEFDLLLYIQDLMAEDRKREAFLEQTAHSLSLPVSSIIADLANLLDEISLGGTLYEDALHALNEVRVLDLLIENILNESQRGAIVFETGSLFKPLKEACEIFRGEASEKGCAIRPIVIMDGTEISMEPSELDDISLLYMRAIYEPRKERFGVKGTLRMEQVQTRIQLDERQIVVAPYRLPWKAFQVLADERYRSSRDQFTASISIGSRTMSVPLDRIARNYMPEVEMVPDALSLAFRNVLQNAVKYSYRAVNGRTERYIKVRCELIDEKYYEVSISNYGIGIERDEIERGKIWEPGYRGIHSHDRHRAGSGLGLSHVKWAVEEVHGGKLSVQSIEQLGGAYLTTFTMKIPIRQEYRIDQEDDDE